MKKKTNVKSISHRSEKLNVRYMYNGEWGRRGTFARIHCKR